MDHPLFGGGNYLLGALAQSGAALVAIIGGVLGARYVSLHSERTAVEYELGRARSARDDAAGVQEAAQRDLRFARVDFFIASSPILRMLTLDNENSREAARNAVLKRGGGDDDVAAYGEASLQQIIDEASQLQLDAKREEMLSHLEFEDPWAVARRHIDTYSIDDVIANYVYYNLAVDESQSGDRQLSQRFVDELLAELKDARKARQTAARSEVDRALKHARERTRAYERTDEHVGEVGARLKALKNGVGFVVSTQVLGIVAVLNVVLPLMMMVPGYYDGNLLISILFSSLFFLGLAVLGRYFWVYGAYLTDTINAMPESAFGLFRKLPRSKKDEDLGEGQGQRKEQSGKRRWSRRKVVPPFEGSRRR